MISLMIGETVSHYRIVERIGEGGMGVVYVAEDILLGRRVAIKTLNSKRGQGDQHFRARFLREARAVSALSHQHIANVYDYGETDEGQPYIVMELVEGQTLVDLMREEKLTIPRAIEIVKQVAEALSEAHLHGIVHRDIKPSNIAINERGVVKVLDFGLAKQVLASSSVGAEAALSEAVHTQTREGIIIGTPMYLSPEQALGLEVDARSDLFSLGSVLYECIAGRPAFAGKSDIEICAEVIRDDPAPPSVFNPLITSELDRIVLKAIAKKPGMRHQTAVELANDLGSSSSESRAPTDVVRKRETAVSVTQDKHTQRVRSVRASSILALIGFAAFGAIALVFLLSRLNTRPLASGAHFARLSTTGNIKEATISADGKYIGAVIDEVGKQSLWIKQVETPNELQIMQPLERQYKGLVFSPKGDYIYFLQETGDTATLCRISVLGGTPQELTPHVDSPVTFSPGGERLAFVRATAEDKSTSLMLADADGSSVTTLMTVKSPQALNLNGFYTSGPAWSPDGNVIAVPGHNITGTSSMDVLAIRVADGRFTAINKQRWNLIEKLIWRADGSGLMMNAVDQPSSPLQLWMLYYPKGDAERLTNDPNSYVNLSATRDSSTVLATKLERLSSAWIIDGNGKLSTKPVSSKDIAGTGIAWTPDAKVIYSATAMGTQNLWIMNPDGNGSRQLTFDDQRKGEPTVSPDGNYVVFVAYREGQPHLWRMDITGKNLIQLTNGKYEDLPRFSRDGKWVIYHSIIDDRYRLRRIPITGGESSDLTEQPATQPDVSPDGKFIACFSRDEPSSSPWRIALVPFEGGLPVKTFSIPASVNPEWPGLRWTADGSSVIYVATSGGVSNLWLQAIHGGAPRQFTSFSEGQIVSFDRSIGTNQTVCVRGTVKRELFLVSGFS
jgi:eukaryotic-like serine/threonine-protein kinase